MVIYCHTGLSKPFNPLYGTRFFLKSQFYSHYLTFSKRFWLLFFARELKRDSKLISLCWAGWRWKKGFDFRYPPVPEFIECRRITSPESIWLIKVGKKKSFQELKNFDPPRRCSLNFLDKSISARKTYAHAVGDQNQCTRRVCLFDREKSNVFALRSILVRFISIHGSSRHL